MAQLLQHRLGQRQVAGAQQHQHTLAGLLEHRHLARGADVIDAGVGASIGQKDESVVHAHRHTVSHRKYPEDQQTPLL
jgi:hypothetical protein